MKNIRGKVISVPTIKKTMRGILNHDGLLYDPCQDAQTGEINSTRLAECAAYQLELYEKDHSTIPEELFEIALVIAEER